jgi:hypothetical protein
VISKKQLLAEAGREKKSTRREDRRDKQNDNTNRTAKAEEQREVERKNKSGIHKNVARDRRQTPKRRGKENAIKRKREGDVQNNKHLIRDCPSQSEAR